MIRKTIKILLVFAILAGSGTGRVCSQRSSGDILSGVSKKEVKTRPAGSAWGLDWPLGEHHPEGIDTVTYNYQRQAIPSLQSDAFATTGNLGAEGINMIFFERPQRRSFFFEDALDAWIPTFSKQRFYNVYIPMTLLSYNTGGGKQNVQDRLRATFAGNVNRKIGIGAMMDYLYSKGSYANQATKDFSFGFSGYYRGDRYQMQAFYNHFNFLNKENGGITDDLYILDPAELQGGVNSIDAKTIPTRLSATHNRLNGDEFYMNHAYNIGFHRDVEEGDTVKSVFVPVTRFIYSLDYRSGHHLFKNTNSTEGHNFWKNFYITPEGTDDNTRYWQLSNTIGVSMLEGFSKWTKFGLAAYATYEVRHYTQTEFDPAAASDPESGLTPLPAGFSIDPKTTRHLMWIGGRLSKTQGSILTYNADARFGVVGDAAGEVDIKGEINTRFRLGRDSVGITARGFFRNTAPSYLLKHFISNHFAWDNDFSKTRDFRVEGELTIPWTNTKIRAGVENIQNYVYFDSESLPRQEGGNIQIFSATLEQSLRFGIWNWVNSATYQASSNQDVLPLPAFSLYSNMFLFFKAFRVLEVQFGVDCNYYTRYYGPDYQPATMSFITQKEQQAGNFAFCDAYLTCKLYKVRFFVMFSHVNQGLFSKNYFAVPHYPLNPRKFQLGLSIDFAN